MKNKVIFISLLVISSFNNSFAGKEFSNPLKFGIEMPFKQIGNPFFWAGYATEFKNFSKNKEMLPIDKRLYVFKINGILDVLKILFWKNIVREFKPSLF